MRAGLRSVRLRLILISTVQGSRHDPPPQYPSRMTALTADVPTPPARTPLSARLVSLDALRGFDMLWIVGGDELGHALDRVGGGAPLHWVSTQLHHVHWAGFRFYDLIFPLFVFMMGTAIPFSLGRLTESGMRGQAWRKILVRAGLMFVIGLFYYGGLSTPVDHIRFAGVLQRLAACYLFAGIAFLYLRPRMLVALCVSLLLGYWALLTFVPVPGFGAADFTEGHNLANWVDKLWLPGRQWNGDHDPEGLLSTLPAISSCLLGVFAGLWLRREDRSGREKALGLGIAGCVLVVLGWTWGLQFPVIKNIWTSSFVLVAGGYSALLLGAFYLVADVWQVRRWTTPFVWVGTNALTIYIISNIVDLDKLAARFCGGDVAAVLDGVNAGLGRVVQAMVVILLVLVICRFLYNRKIFLRL